MLLVSRPGFSPVGDIQGQVGDGQGLSYLEGSGSPSQSGWEPREAIMRF